MPIVPQTLVRAPALLVSLAVLAATVAGCGPTQEPTDPDVDAGAQAPDLAGRYTSGCLDFSTEDAPNIFTLDVDLTSDRWALDYVVHGTDDCTAPVLTVHIEGPYELTAPSEAVDGAWEGSFFFDEKTMTPHVEDMVATLNAIEGCGDGPFTLDGTTSVLEHGCTPFGQYPVAECSQDFDLVSLDDDGLRFGNRPADNDMCTEAKRPTELSPILLTRS